MVVPGRRWGRTVSPATACRKGPRGRTPVAPTLSGRHSGGTLSSEEGFNFSVTEEPTEVLRQGVSHERTGRYMTHVATQITLIGCKDSRRTSVDNNRDTCQSPGEDSSQDNSRGKISTPFPP